MKTINFLHNLKVKNKGQKIQQEVQNFHNLNETLEIIPITKIEAILNNEEIYKMFKKYDKNLKYFGENIKKVEYIVNIIDYMKTKEKLALEIYPKEKERYELITGYKIKEEKDYTQEELKEKELIKFIKTLLSNQEEVIKYLGAIINTNNYNEIYNKSLFTVEEIYLGIKRLSLDSDFRTDKFQEEKINIMNSIFKLKHERENINYFGKINNHFKTAVMSNIPNNLSKTQLARAIYIELNKRIQYDEKMMYYDQDLSLDFIKKIYNKNIDEIDEKNNKITCKTWAYLYSTFLHEYGIKSFVSGKKHKKVCVILENDIIQADATNSSTNGMTDISNLKMGLPPQNYLSVTNKHYNYEDIDKNLGYSYKTSQMTQSTKNIIDEFNENDIVIDEDIILKMFTDLMVSAKKLIDEENNMSAIECHNYYKILLSSLNLDKIKYKYDVSSDLYKIDENNELKSINVLIISNSERTVDNQERIFKEEVPGYSYKYIVYDKEIKYYNYEQLKQLIDEEKYTVRIKKQKETNINKEEIIEKGR